MDAQVFYQKSEQLFVDQTKELKSSSDQQYSIQMFLNEIFLTSYQEKNQKISAETLQQEIKLHKKSLKGQKADETPSACRKKSIFHNFQKHLITLLKKIVNIRKSSLKNCDNFALITALWTAFFKCKAFNKKIMHTVFGCVGDASSFEDFKSISEQFEQFKYILTKYSREDISKAQSSIRQIVVLQAKAYSKFYIQSNSNICRFDEFYEYFSSFLQQIEAGSMSKRMSKTRKIILVKKLAKRPTNQ